MILASVILKADTVSPDAKSTGNKVSIMVMRRGIIIKEKLIILQIFFLCAVSCV